MRRCGEPPTLTLSPSGLGARGAEVLPLPVTGEGLLVAVIPRRPRRGIPSFLADDAVFQLEASSWGSLAIARDDSSTGGRKRRPYGVMLGQPLGNQPVGSQVIAGECVGQKDCTESFGQVLLIEAFHPGQTGGEPSERSERPERRRVRRVRCSAMSGVGLSGEIALIAKTTRRRSKCRSRTSMYLLVLCARRLRSCLPPRLAYHRDR